MILDIRDLSVATRDAPAATLLHDINLGVEQGSRVGLVGESGAGKTTLIRAMTGFLPVQRFQCQGSVTVGETDVLRATPTERRRAVSAAIAVIWQDSITALNPCRRVGTQIRDTLLFRGARSRRQAHQEALEWSARVGLHPPRDIFERYPHELSGGMRQRISLALGLCGGQPILVADEPTSALDMVRQRACVTLIDRLCREDSTTLIFVSHDLALVASLCDHLVVLQHGSILDAGPTATVLADPRMGDLVERTRRRGEWNTP